MKDQIDGDEETVAVASVVAAGGAQGMTTVF